MNRQLLGGFAALGLAVLLFTGSGSADTPGRHPRYLHARTDLRTAQLILRGREEPNVMRHILKVDQAIDRAVAEIDRAAVLDRKDIADHPRVDTSLDRRGRFRKVMALLRSARADISREEDNPRATGWRDHAYHHIDEAIEQLQRAARDLRMDHLEGF
jgi:hypothetical protein